MVSSIKQQSIKAMAWDFVGKIAGQTVMFIISVFLARLLSPQDFGLLAMVNVVIALSTTLIDMGLGVALIQRKEVSDIHYGSVFFFNMAVGLLLMTALFFSAPFIADFYNNQILVPIARVMSVVFVLSSIGNVIRVKLRKELEYGIPAKAGIIASVVSGILGIGMAFSGFGVWSLVANSLLNPIISNAYLFYKVKWRPKLIYQWAALKDLWNFGFKMFLSGILETFVSNADSIIIGKLFSPAVLGFYYRARSLNNYVVVYSSGSIMNVLFPTFSIIQDDRVRFVNAITKGYHIINFLAFYLTGLFFIIGDALILFLFGEKWEPAIPYFRLIIVGAFGYPLSALLVNILKACGNSSGFLKLEIIKKIALILALCFGFLWGIEGYLICSIFVTVFSVVMNMHFAGKQIDTGLMYFARISIPYLLILIIGSGAFFIGLKYLNVHYLSQILIGLIGFSGYFFGAAWLLKLHGIMVLIQEVKNLLKKI